MEIEAQSRIQGHTGAQIPFDFQSQLSVTSMEHGLRSALVD